MNLDESLRALVLEAVSSAFTDRAAWLREELGRPRLLPIKQAPVAYRAILEAERSGELTVYRVGHASLVDEQELFAWVKRTGHKPEPEAAQPSDEIAALIDLGDRRRAGRRGAK